ncbi:ABC transporter substrate-binding protein [Tateyamaria sp. Alg231-49]|uniref:ABC transporter substrate-binding protein n=1 Tax=Tateyamaria sp. Alg231-49 TaxID=1922219 RepID=UPI000D54DB13|nr:ABC transporter substrate-binding protein [Tateyamaria sp. Alg231-49]
MTRIDRRALFTSGAAAALLAATGVSAQPQRGGRLRAALSMLLFDQAVAATVFDNLTEVAADGTLRGDLATGWSSDAQAMRWRFTLRDDVAFHDGEVFSAEHLRSLPMTVEVIDPVTADIVLDTPNPNLPYLLAHPGYEIRSETGAGTGLYAVQKLEPGRHFIGARVANHWKKQSGWFDSVEFVQFSVDAVRSEALRDGMVDVADIAALDPLSDPRDFQILPGGRSPTHIAATSVAVPLSVGKSWPLDNLRMAERWWIS